MKPEKGRRVLCHFEDADGHVLIPCQVSDLRDETGYWGQPYWGQPHRVSGLSHPTRYSPCRVGLTFPIRRMSIRDAIWIQSAEIAHEVPCLFEGDEDGPYEPCDKCGRRPPPGTGWAPGYEA